MDFLTLAWWLVGVVSLVLLVATGAMAMLWLRCDALREHGTFLRLQLDGERAHSAELQAEVMELQAAVRAELFHVEQLQRQVDLLK
ncbi:hypothetical protein FXN65_17635 [Metapseudomonas lalkuanensis]|uniref:Uncharacterized protein n=1 Tax=Metapseudomonas lalkuanensis TaxID=2604832 RepID=A0A5J6QMW5_9GAMM|nr:hypothetical protein [Pseudomonas lalkuanensis]QEY63783.1 hypothetical protein FXN65_17635 [Pseudomonas lalkuanensis]